MVSGSWDGEITVFTGTGVGKFEAGQRLKHSDGKEVKHNQGASPAFVDLDSDGDLDMVCSWKSGEFLSYINESSEGMATFSAGTPILAGGKPVRTSDGRPTIADWNSDNVPDILLGSDGTGVQWMQGTRTDGKLSFGAAQSLVSVDQATAWSERQVADRATMKLKTPMLGARPSPTVADWNGDGKLDLLVGDFTNVAAPAKVLTAAEKARLKRLQAEYKTVSQDYFKAMNTLSEKAAKEVGLDLSSNERLPQEAIDKYVAAMIKLQAADKNFAALEKRFQTLRTEISKLEPDPQATGFVWVYLRK